MALNFFRDKAYEDLLNNPEFEDVRKTVLPVINKLIAAPEAVFRGIVFDFIDQQDVDRARSLNFILLLLMRQSFGVVNNGN